MILYGSSHTPETESPKLHKYISEMEYKLKPKAEAPKLKESVFTKPS